MKERAKTTATPASPRIGHRAHPTSPVARTPVAIVCVAILIASLLGCSSSTGDDAGASTPLELSLAHTSWEESYAIALLTEVMMEDYLGYDVQLTEVPDATKALEGVSGGEYDAFQDVWTPDMEDEMSEIGGLDPLESWFLGTTRAGIATPEYVGARSMEDLEEKGVREVFLLGPEASALEPVPPDLLDDYGLRARTFPDVGAMISAAEPLYRERKPFALQAYSPNRMDLAFDLTYVEGEERLAEQNAPRELEVVARDGLRREDPVAYAFLNHVSLTESQVESLEQSIGESDDPRDAVSAWTEERPNYVGLWLSEVRNASS